MQLIGFFLLMVLYGAMYSLPALTPAMAVDLQTTRADLQAAYALAGLVIAASSPIAGQIVDRRGPRAAMAAGGVGLVAALVGLAVVRAPWQVYVLLIGLAAPAHGLLQVTTIVGASRVGAGKRGSALGLAGAGIGAGLTLLVPGAIWLSGQVGWRTAVLALAAMAMIVILPALALTPAHSRTNQTTRLPLAVGQQLASLPFALLFTGGIAVGLADEAMYQHLVPHLASAGMPLGDAGVVLGFGSLGYLIGQMAGGRGSDRWGRWRVGVAAASLMSIGLVALGLLPTHGPLLVVAALVAGLGMGATIATRSATFADVFDGPTLGVLTGAYQWAYALGGSAMGWLGAYLFEWGGSYVPALIAGGLVGVVWLICLRLALMHEAPPMALTAAPGEAGD